MITGGQVRPRRPNSAIASSTALRIPGSPSPSTSMRKSVPKAPPLWTAQSSIQSDVGLDPVLDVGGENADVVAGIAPGDRVATIGAKRQVSRDAFGGAAYRALESDEAAGQHRLVSEHGINPRHADIGAYGPLILLRDVEVLDDCPEHLLRQLLRLTIAHAHERMLDVVGQGRRGKTMGLVGRLFEQCLGNSATGAG